MASTLKSLKGFEGTDIDVNTCFFSSFPPSNDWIALEVNVSLKPQLVYV